MQGALQGVLSGWSIHFYIYKPNQSPSAFLLKCCSMRESHNQNYKLYCIDFFVLLVNQTTKIIKYFRFNNCGLTQNHFLGKYFPNVRTMASSTPSPAISHSNYSTLTGPRLVLNALVSKRNRCSRAIYRKPVNCFELTSVVQSLRVTSPPERL